jgi:hypothetical protein
MRKTLFAALVLPLLAGCAQPSQSSAGGADSAGTPSAAPAPSGAGQVTVELVQGQAGSSAGGDQGATAEGAAGGAVIHGTITTPNPCHKLSGAVERSGETVTVRVSATVDPEVMCIASIGAIPYTATVRGLPAGSYTLRVLHVYPGTGWETATALEARFTAR